MLTHSCRKCQTGFTPFFTDENKKCYCGGSLRKLSTPIESFAMFTVAGDRAVGRLLSKVKECATGEQAEKMLTAGRYRINAKHGEVFDTAVREAIYSALAFCFEMED